MRLLLVGAGHAHLYVVQHAAELIAAGYRVQLLAPRYFHYSGLASATATGDVAAEAGRIDVAALARRSGVEHLDGTLASLDRDRRTAVTAAGVEVGYDVVSLNIGSVAEPPGASVDPSVVRVKPLSDLARLADRLVAVGPSARVTVLGGGTSGLELSAHLAVRRGVARVHLLEAGSEPGTELPPGARRRLQRLLARRGVTVRTGCDVRDLGAGSTTFADGTELAHDVAVLATGLSASPLVAELGLGDGDGIPVRATLQHLEHDEIYATGDCARFVPMPLPLIGVHGVRQGPVLHRSLLARMSGDSLPTYDPQPRALAILDLGGGRGLATYGRLWWEGRSALWLKRLIDRRWLRRYQAS